MATSNFEAMVQVIAYEIDRCDQCGKRIRQVDVDMFEADGGEGVPAVCASCAELAALPQVNVSAFVGAVAGVLS